MADPGARSISLVSPIHAILLAFPIALYPAALITDITYLRTSVIQWTNFSQWLIAGADVFAGLLLAWALVSYFGSRARRAGGSSALYLVVVAVMVVVGVINALHHSKDGWASVGTAGVLMSSVCALLAIVAAFLHHSGSAVRETR